MALAQRAWTRARGRRGGRARRGPDQDVTPGKSTSPSDAPRATGARRLASPGQVAVIYRWGAWLLALGLIVSGTTTFGASWRRGDVLLLLGCTAAVNIAITLGLRPYMRLMRRFPPVLVLDVLFCLWVYSRSNIWTSPFQFYSYAALMLPVALFYFWGALAGSLLFLALDLALLYTAGDTLAWARATHQADTYLMQLAIVPLLGVVFAYPNWLFAQLRRTQRLLDQVERERLLEAERTRIARSLHDSVAQMLFGIGMLSEGALARLSELGGPRGPVAGTAGAGGPEDRAPLADVLRQVRDLARRGNLEMRRAIYALNEPGPSRRGLVVSLRALLADLAARMEIETHLEVSGGDPPETLAELAGLASAPTPAPVPATRAASGPGDLQTAGDDPAPGRPHVADGTLEAAEEGPELPLPVAHAFYKVAREALANVEKHADAPNVWVELRLNAPHASHDARRATLVVRDDGRGFQRSLLARPGDPDEDELGQPHFGLGNMRQTIEAVGGRLEVTTGPGRGTRVVASAPVE